MSNVYILIVKSGSYKDNKEIIKYVSQIPRKGESMFDSEGYTQTITNVIWYPPKTVLRKYKARYCGYSTVEDLPIEAIVYV